MGFTVDLFYPKDKKGVYDTKQQISTEFVDDLELRQIARQILPHNDGFALEILKELCNDPDVISYRQDVMEDFLTYPQLEIILYNVIKKVYDFERSIESKNRNANSLLDISIRLKALQNYIDCVQSCYKFAKNNKLKSTGLQDMMDEIIDVHDSKDFKVLVQETSALAKTLDSTVQSLIIAVNLDNCKRPNEMAVLSFSNQQFKQKPLLSKLLNITNENEIKTIGKIYRYDRDDYKTRPSPFEIALFDNLNSINKDILNHFSGALNNYYRSNISGFLKIQSQLDFYLGVKRFIRQYVAQGQSFCRPKIANKDNRCFNIKGMYDLPLVIQMYADCYQNRKKLSIVTNDVKMDDNGRIFILTGPNHGGKTTYTRAVGVCQALFQAGLPVPGTYAYISPVDHIFTLFPREEVVGINTSRLTQECKQCKTTFSQATKYSLILMNETFSSTTYAECLYIASGFLRLMRKTGCRGIFATHMIELAQKINELEKETNGDSSFVSMVAQIQENEYKKMHTLTYKICQSKPYAYSYANEILHKYGINFEEMLEQDVMPQACI